MKESLKKFSAPAIMGLAMVTVVVAAQAGTTPPQVSATATESTAAQAQFTGQQRARIFAAASRDALALVEAARQEIGQENAAEARVHLERASMILGQVQQGLDSQPLSVDGGNRNVISIFAQLGVVDPNDVTDDMRDQLNEIGAYVALGEHDKVVEGLENLGIPTVYQYVEMPVGSTLGQVKTAIASIDAQQMDKAAEDLQAATASLHSDSVIVGMEDEEQAG